VNNELDSPGVEIVLARFRGGVEGGRWGGEGEGGRDRVEAEEGDLAKTKNSPLAATGAGNEGAFALDSFDGAGKGFLEPVA
jgi:hypothetical protein